MKRKLVSRIEEQEKKKKTEKRGIWKRNRSTTPMIDKQKKKKKRNMKMKQRCNSNYT